MKHIKSISWLLALVLALSLCLTLPVSAAEDGAVWLEAEAADDGVRVCIYANTTIADGQITLSYDSAALTYTDVTVDSNYVLSHAVNGAEAGVVKIAWIAADDYGLDGTAHLLMQLHFAGTSVEALAIHGQAYTPEGEMIAIATPVLTDLQMVIESAAAMQADQYTAESFAALENALEAARTVLADVTASQAEVDAAIQSIINAIDALVTPEPTVTVPATTTTAATEPTVPSTTEQGDAQSQGGSLGLIIVIVAICVAGAVAAVIIIKRRGNK